MRLAAREGTGRDTIPVELMIYRLRRMIYNRVAVGDIHASRDWERRTTDGRPYRIFILTVGEGREMFACANAIYFACAKCDIRQSRAIFACGKRYAPSAREGGGERYNSCGIDDIPPMADDIQPRCGW